MSASNHSFKSPLDRSFPSSFLPLMLSSLLIALITYGGMIHAEPIKAPEKRTAVSDFDLEDLKGNQINLSDFKGKVVVVNFWATWCAPCKQELPHLNRIYKENKDQGLVVLAISTDSPQTQAQVRTVSSAWSVKILLDPDGTVVDQLNPRGVAPYTLFIDRQGRMASDHDGYSTGDEAEMEKIIKALLKEKK